MYRPRLGLAVAGGTAKDPEAYLEAVLALAAAGEAGGADLFVVDGRGPHGQPQGWRPLDPYVVLGAVATVTSSMRLCALLPADERAPSLAAKAIATLDVCSAGRALLLLAAPSLSRCALASSPTDPLGLLGECMEVVTAMLSVPAPTVVGRQVSIRQAWNEPRGAKGPPPVGIAVASANLGVTLAALRVAPELVAVELAPRDVKGWAAGQASPGVFGQAAEGAYTLIVTSPPNDGDLLHLGEVLESGWTGMVVQVELPFRRLGVLLERVLAGNTR